MSPDKCRRPGLLHKSSSAIVQRRELLGTYSLVEIVPLTSSSSSTTSSSSGFDDDLIENNEADLLFFPLMHYLLSGERRPRVENYEQIVDAWSDEEFQANFRLSRYTAIQLIDELQQSVFIPDQPFGMKPIPAKICFLIFLWFIVNTEPLRTIADRFGVSIASIFRIVRRVISWLLTKLDDTIRWPQGNEVLAVCEGFLAQRNIPGVIGVIDSTHIHIEKPLQNNRDYFNRKKFFSLNLQAVVDSKMRFTSVYCGEPGSLHDARVLRRSPLYQTATVQPEVLFPHRTFILGDSAFPSLSWLVPPFRDNGYLTQQQREFNFLHSSTRMVVERSFGLLKGRFRRIKFFSEYKHINFVSDVVIAACILHNLCINANEDAVVENMDSLLQVENHVENQIRGDRRMQLFRELFPVM